MEASRPARVMPVDFFERPRKESTAIVPGSAKSHMNAMKIITAYGIRKEIFKTEISRIYIYIIELFHWNLGVQQAEIGDNAQEKTGTIIK